MNKIKVMNFLLFIVFLGFLSVISAKEKVGDKDRQLYKTNINDHSNFITINQVFMWCKNDGDGSHDPRTDGQGFYWPGGENATIGAVFEDGLIWAGKIGREVRMNGNTHRQGLQAGKILDNGLADDPSLANYRVYKIRKTWESFPPGDRRDQYQKDLEEWPVTDGAPWDDKNGNGVYDVGEAQFIGDEVLWYVANDLDPSRTTFTYGSQPIGLEQQCTIFAFQRSGDLGDIVFKKYKMINKGQNKITDMYFGMWSDTDLGDANDDYTGCDTSLSLGYTWNSDNNDAGYYGLNPPAMGYDFFQGPIVPANASDSAKFLGKWRKGHKNLPMTSFTFYINDNSSLYRDPSQGIYSGSLEFYNYLKGFIWNGNPFLDPSTNAPTKFVLSGDPVAGTGWYEGKGWPGGPDPGDRRHLMCSGPFTMAPSDTQEIVVGLLIARGNNNLNSITELKRKDRAAQISYDLDFKLTDPPPQPVLHSVSMDKAISLWWEQNAENYSAKDPILPDQITVKVNDQNIVFPVDNKNYKFEGYRVWQFSNSAGADPKLLAVYDIKDAISDVYNFRDSLNKIDGKINPTVLLAAPNDGIRRFINISTDAYTNGPLYDGTPYYFGVTAYGISKYSDPPYLESTPNIIEVRPTTRKADLNSPYQEGENVIAERTAGFGDGKITFRVVDPLTLTGDHYKVLIKGHENVTNDTLRYDLVNVTTGDTLLKDMKDFVTGYVSTSDAKLYGTKPLTDTINKPVIQGFQLFVQNVGRDSINYQPTKYRIKDVLEVKGPGGSVLDPPVPVLDELNSTKQWMIKAKGILKRLIFQSNKNDEGLGYVDYELRFGPPEFSQFYVSGYKPSFNPVFADDPLGKGTLPFEVWNIGLDDNSASDDTIMSVKVLDFDRADTNRAVLDTMWTRIPSGPNAGDWEEIFAYRSPNDPHNLPSHSGKIAGSNFAFGSLSISGEIPAPGTVVRITSYKPLNAGDQFDAVMTAANFNDKTLAKSKIDEITVYPNPYFGANSLETSKYQRFVRFTNLPKKVSLRIYSLAGIFIRKLDKDDNSPWMDWDLLNKDGLPISSGMYIAYLEMPDIGTKILKLAVIVETQYIDRL